MRNRNKQPLLLLLPLLLLALVTMTLPSVVFADDDSTESEDTEETESEETEETEEEDTESEAGAETNDDDSDSDDDSSDDTETEETETEDTDDVETETQPESVTADASLAPTDNPGNGDTQPGRVGTHDTQTSPEGANAGGIVIDPTITGDPTVVDPGDIISANCFGKVIQHEAQEHLTDPDEGTLGEHSSDPVPGDDDNETPRQGIGNQNQGHPAAHGAFNSQFEEEDAENVAENC